MRLLTLDQLSEEPADAVLRGTWILNLIVFLVAATLFTAAACLALGIIPHGVLPAAWIWGVAGLIFLWMAAGFAALVIGCELALPMARPNPLDPLLGKPHRPGSELTRDDLAWAQPMRLTYIHKRKVGQGYEYHHYLDLGLSPQATRAIDVFLRDEKVDANIRNEFAPQTPKYKGWTWLARPGVLRLYLLTISPLHPPLQVHRQLDRPRPASAGNHYQ